MKITSLKNKLTLLATIIMTLFGVVLALFVFVTSKTDLYELRKLSVMELTREQARGVNSIIRHGRTTARNVALQPDIINFANTKTGNVDNILEIYRSTNQFLAVFVLDSTGLCVASTEKKGLGSNLAYREYFKAASQGLAGEEQTVGAVTLEYGYFFSYPIYNAQNEIKGVAVVKLSPDTINSTIREGRIAENGNEMLVNSAGVILYSSNQEEIMKNFSDVKLDKSAEYGEILKKIQANDITFSHEFYNKTTKKYAVLSARKVGDSNLYVIAEIMQEDILANVVQRSIQLAAMTLLIIMVAQLILYTAISRLLKPLDIFKKYFRDGALGNVNVKLVVKSGDELEQLANAINTTNLKLKESYGNLESKVESQTKELKSRIEELQKTRISMLNVLHDLSVEKDLSSRRAKDLEKFGMAVEHAGDHIIITDADGVILYANRAVERITGYSRSETIGKTSSLWGKQMPLEFYKDFWYKVKTLKQDYLGEITNVRKSGEKYIADIHVTPILDSLGKVIFFVAIERDITKAKEIDRMKTEFITLASHQLRTPLTAIKWYLEMLITGDVGTLTEQQATFVKQVNDSNERMIDLVTGLLNVSRIESGRMIIEPMPADIREIISSVLDDLKPRIAQKKTDIIFSANVDIPKVSLDAKMIRQVFINLLSNAIKYTREAGQIIIMVSKTSQELVVQIADNGYGIPPKDKDRVFSKFYRGENVIPVETDGNGLGLYLVKAIIDSSGGKIWFDSELNKGTTFWFTLPLSGMAPKQGEVRLDS